jgi:predicted secreted Zn-dependent protease
VKVLLLISIFLSFYSSAETKVVEDTLFYEVAPTSKGDLLDTLNRTSPIRENGDVFHGYTKYEINWRFWWKFNNDQCAFTKVETTLKLKYTMPQLKSSKSDVKVVWSNWYPNLEIHEKGHGKLAIDTAYKIDKKLLSIDPKANCNILEKAGNKLAHKLMGELKKASKQYDIKTNHGETQNAWLYLHL